MRFLLDTHAFLWWVFDDAQLSEPARFAISDPDNEVLFSPASAWEIATKVRLGKLDSAKRVLVDLPGLLTKAGFVELPITTVHAQRAGSWPHPHRDPFDRMLAAQCAIEDLTLISKDQALVSFGVHHLW